MADDPTGSPKPTARRRRPSRSAASPVVPASGPTVDPAPLESGAPIPDVVVPATDDAAEEAAEEAAEASTEEAQAAEVIAEAESTIWPPLDARSPNAWVCPFLRSVDDRNGVDLPREAPEVANRCVALDEAVPQSLRQQDLVCLTTSHVDCPRYLRGAMVTTVAEVAPVRSTPMVTPAMFAALALLAATFTVSIVFTFVRGGLDLGAGGTTGSAAPSSSANAVVPTPARSAAPSLDVSQVPSVAPSPAEVPSQTAEPNATPVLTPAPTPAPTAAPTLTATPAPSSSRYALLTACPDKPDCWLYRVRPGNNLYSIARFFGVPLAKVQALNPWTKTSVLKAGRILILPPPTR